MHPSRFTSRWAATALATPQEAGGPPIRLSYLFTKRLLDVLVSSLALLALLPAFLLIALAIALTSRGPVLYRSTRVGRGGRRMAFLKFRTMVTGAEAQKLALEHLNEKSGPIFKSRNDPRVTRVGRLLRRYSLDELPQLLHVLAGDMSLVGPRPHLPSEVERYRPGDHARLAVKPGLTCYWQVGGRSDLSYEEWIAMDLRYVREMGLRTDLRLLAATPKAVLGGKGAY
jgi:lipopolysaccharide/colanic/teichoic acid biosynthesis glycosyltransferase